MARCKICKSKFEPKYFLQKACLNPACLAEWSKVDREVKADKKHKAKKKELKDNDRSYRAKVAQQAFNAYIRLRDEDEPCVSCQRHHSGQYHAGHYRSVGACPELRFEELNNNKQCAPCNNHLSGNIADYRINLIKKIGLDSVEWLEGKHEPKKYTCEELKAIELKYKQKLKMLE
tara:strand:- start:268 stop:792 length:525 start_codon:yes stop_codon:yes gene_type:complete